ncbi:polycomb group protein EMBRYONIC FLOWER 2 [Artemisia annua]|uniref:Polycomb group protein EMBRYONIC FLOWER 2 n=1 Tax=Artemisia annua TaxID=35608 RepID=A0A2U1K9N8_ARTAN|nr:polycomb group protein EMBRYONIC FLOWER 2 [Artemisia annua]
MAAVSFYLFEEITRPPESYVTEKGCIIVHSISNTIILTRNPTESSLPVVQLSAEQEGAARQSLKVYCQQIKYYNILHDHALDKPLDLQRCLHYKVQENRKRMQRSGNVTFNFKCYDDMCQMSEVMEDYSCAICLIKCASFKIFWLKRDIKISTIKESRHNVVKEF